MQFRARFIGNIIQFAGQQGADRRLLLELVDNDLEGLMDENLMYPANTYNQVIEKAVELTGDPCFGLHLGESLSLSAAGLIVQIAQSSRTVKEALSYMVEFANLGCSALPFSLLEQKEEWELSIQPNPLWQEQSPASVRHTMDGMIIFTIREFHTLTRQKYFPLRIHFTRSRPERFMEYERLLHCPVRYEQELDAIYLDKDQVAEPVVTNDYQLLKILVKYAEEKLQQLQLEQGFKTVVKQAILGQANPSFPTVEQVAMNLNLSTRTLQRRLSDEGYSFKSLLDELRRDLALDYLGNPSLSVKQIAYLLDYAEPSSFIRSFKRWEGISPSNYRMSNQR